MALIMKPCPTCGGKGRKDNKQCPRCGGMGKVAVPLKKGPKGLIGSLAPMSPTQGPPLPSGVNVHWPKVPNKMKKGFTFLPEVHIPTPFGGISLPRYGLPPLVKPAMGKEGKKAFRQAVGSDLAFIIAQVPVVGDTVGHALEDMHRAEIKKLISPAEFDDFMQQTKVAPDTISLLRIYMTKGAAQKGT